MNNFFRKFTVSGLLLFIILVGGCGEQTIAPKVPEDYTKYEDTNQNFSFYYPEDWVINKTNDEIIIKHDQGIFKGAACRLISEKFSEETQISSPSNYGLKIQRIHRSNTIHNDNMLTNQRHVDYSTLQDKEFQAGPHSAYSFISRHQYKSIASHRPAIDNVKKNYFSFYLPGDKKTGYLLVCEVERNERFSNFHNHFETIAKSIRFNETN